MGFDSTQFAFYQYGNQPQSWILYQIKALEYLQKFNRNLFKIHLKSANYKLNWPQQARWEQQMPMRRPSEDKICTNILIRKRKDILVQNAAITHPKQNSRKNTNPLELETVISQQTHTPTQKYVQIGPDKNCSELISATSRRHGSGPSFLSLDHNFSLIFPATKRGERNEELTRWENQHETRGNSIRVTRTSRRRSSRSAPESKTKRRSPRFLWTQLPPFFPNRYLPHLLHHHHHHPT